MAQQLQVNLAFSADTAKAKSQINELMSSLSKISQPKSQIFDDRELREAANAAKDLQYHLSQAVNVNTGKLDLNKFSLSLSQSKQNLTDLYNSLAKAGPQGQQAFLQLASGIAASDSKVLNLNAKIKELGVTLKNTVKWQLSSSLVHGFMGAIQSAIGYTRELNSSLNDIRIVTGYSADQMAQFADQANKAAKSLSTTTNNYAKASLIYFQQGLSDEEVSKRTDITVKMANVANSNAELVSEQMTAVWNNFYDGSKSLEYYSDVMTALGAATATSTDEISEGLSKFAAVADTVGLSYEYATAALATITSNTRESADVVGNALKTLFARIQGLQLGETMEDGVDLNKYSEALEKVGISIFEQNGELKAMDSILTEMADKWGTLSNAQQVALAQTVAGVRQYTQLIALMDNWNLGDSDSFISNLNTAYNAEGTLQEQFDIYEEGWEAASNRVEASIERIYQAILDDKAIVSLLNGLEDILNLTGAIMEGFGGMQGILLLISGIITRNIAKEVPGAIENLKNNFKIITGMAQKEKIGQVQQSSNLLDREIKSGQLSTGQLTRYQATKDELDSMVALEQIRHRLTDAEYESRKNKIVEKKSIQELVAVKQDELEALEKEYQLKQKERQKKASKTTNAQMANTARERIDILREDEAVAEQQIASLEKQISRLQEKAQKKVQGGKDGLTLNDSNNLAMYRTQLAQLKQEQETRLEEIRLQEERHKKLSEISQVNQAEGREDNYDNEIARKSDQLKQLYELKAKQDLVREDFNKQIESWTLSGAGISLLDADSQTKEIEKLRTAIRNYGKELSTIDPDNLNVSNLNNEIDKAGDNINELIATFKRWAQSSSEIQQLTSEIQDAENAVTDLENKIEEVENDLKTLDPSGFDKIQQEAQDAGERVGNLSHQISKLQNEADQQDINLKVDTMSFSQALTTVGSLGLSLSALFAEVGTAISVCFDEGATSAEKFTAVLSMVPAALMTLGEVIQGLAALPEAMIALKKGFSIFTSGELIGKITSLGTTIGGFFAGISGKAIAATAGIKGLGAAFTGLSATLGPVGAGIAIVVAALMALFALFKAGQAIYNAWAANDPGKQFEAAKKATEAMADAAKEAEDAYQGLLNTINSYDSAIGALDGLTQGTTEFTNKLIEANNYAQELIDKYNLMPDDYFVNDQGLIEFKSGVLDDKTAEYQEKTESTQAALMAARNNQTQRELDVLANENIAGLTADTFKKTYEDIIAEAGTLTGFEEMDQQRQLDILAQSRFGSNFDELGPQLKGIIQNALKAVENNAYDTYDEAYRNAQAQRESSVKTGVINALSNEKEYQASDYKNLIVEETAAQYQEAYNTALANVKQMSVTELQDAFVDILPEGYTRVGKTIYDTEGNVSEEYTNITDNKRAMMVAATQASEAIEQSGIELANSLSAITNTLIDEEKEVADALLNGDLSGLTEDQINQMSKMSVEEIATAYPFITQLEALGIDVNTLLNQLTINLDNWEPPQFNLDSWKKDYATKMDIINSLEAGDEISAEDYALLGEEYQQYFQVQADGTAILIAKAEELRAAIREIEIGELEEDIRAKQNTVNTMNETNIVAESGRELDFNVAHNAATQGTLHETWDEAYINAVNEALGTAYETSQQAAEGYNNYINSLNQSQNTLASTAEDLDQLNEMLSMGKIDQDEYDANFEGTLAKDAIKYDLDYEEVLDYAESLRELNKELADNEQLSKEIALAEKKQAKGADDLIDNYKDYVKVLKKAKLDNTIKDTEKYSKTIKSLQEDLSLLTGYSKEIFTDEFINSNEVQKALLDISNGIDGATERLKVLAAAQEIKIKTGIEVDQVALDALQTEITNLNNQDIEIGAIIDEAPALDALANLLQQAGWTTAQIQEFFNNLGWQPEISYEEVQVKDLSTHASNGFVEVVEGNPYEGYTVVSKPVSAFSGMDQEEWVKVPKIGSKSTGGGGYKKVDPIGNSSSKKPSSGGGGGGSSKPKHAEKKNDSEKERYHTLQNQLEDLTAEYEALADASDRAFGQEKLDNIDAEIEKTDELIAKQEEYLNAIEANLPVDKAVMSAYYKDLIGGNIQFDEKGNISNYDAIQDAMFAKYNAMADALDEDSEEWQVFEKKYEQLEKYIQQYEETYDLLRDEEQTYQDLLNQRIDLELEKVTYSVEIALDIPESQIALLEYQLGRIDDDAFQSGESVALLTKQAEQLYDQIQINKQGLNEALKLSLSTSEIISLMAGDISVLNGRTFTEDQIDAIKEYRDNLLDLNEEFDDIRETIEEKVMEVFDAWGEKLDDGIEQLEHYGDVLESYRNIIDIVGEDGLGISDEFMKNLNEAQIGNAIDKVNATRDAYEAMMKAQQEAEKALEEAKERGDEASIKMWTENLAELTDEANSAQEEFLSAWEDALDTVAEQFEMTVERVIESFNESIYALGGLEGLSEEFSRQQETADMMVDDYQKIYELSKLNRDIQRTLDDTDVIAGKQKLLKLQEKINDLEAEGVEMSQYDLEYLQAEYELRMAEIELENAQKAKDTVRMSRDNEGNWSYVYTTNTDAVDEAQQKYEDALYAMQDLSSNYIDEMSEKLISTSQEMEEALASLRIQDFASIDDYYAEVERIKKEYGEQLALEQAELQKAIDNNKVLYDEDMTNYAKATGEKYRLAEEFVTSFKDSLLGSIMDSESESANFTNIISSAVDDLTTGLMEAATTYYQNLEAAMNAADTSTGDFAEDTAANIDAVVEKSKEGAEAIDQMAIEMTEAFQEITDMVTNWQETYGMAMEKIIQSNLDVIESFNNMLEALSIDADKINVSYDINTSPEKDNPAAFDTGGYTGKWGDIGKLAVLHEKELILNENDTSNFLKAINISKVILDMIETNAKYASMGLGQITPTVIKEEAKETLEQIVHITADFSGVKDRNEIEEAFKSLINTSSQYANRK